MTNKKNAAPANGRKAAQHPNKIPTNSTGNSAAAQRVRLLEALRKGPISTIEARKVLDVLMPAARIHEMRHLEGHNIQVTWVRQETDAGKLHRVALYSIRPGVWRRS